MERRIQIWNLIINAMDSITKYSKFQEVGMKQIYSYIKGFSFPISKFIDTRTIKIEEIYLALTENSDCVELFQFESITKDDIFFSLRDSPEKLIQKASKMQQYGINEILKEKRINSEKNIGLKINENDHIINNSNIANSNISRY